MSQFLTTTNDMDMYILLTACGAAPCTSPILPTAHGARSSPQRDRTVSCLRVLRRRRRPSMPMRVDLERCTLPVHTGTARAEVCSHAQPRASRARQNSHRPISCLRMGKCENPLAGHDEHHTERGNDMGIVSLTPPSGGRQAILLFTTMAFAFRYSTGTSLGGKTPWTRRSRNRGPC